MSDSLCFIGNPERPEVAPSWTLHALCCLAGDALWSAVQFPWRQSPVANMEAALAVLAGRFRDACAEVSLSAHQSQVELLYIC